MKPIYADNNATTPLANEVLAAMMPFLTEHFGNPSSAHDAAREPARAIAHARRRVAELLGGVAPEQVLFTSGATESNNAALLGAAKANPARRHIVTTEVEHPSVLECCAELAREGYDVTFLPVDRDGLVDPGAFARALRSDTLLASVIHANNETGVISPIERLSRMAKERDLGILFHTDATQSVGKVVVNLRADLEHIDFLSLSGHKLHGPKGVGALFIRQGVPWRPFLFGGHQEEGRRGGTYNVPGIVGFGHACRLAEQEYSLWQEVTRHRDRLESLIVDQIDGAQVNGRAAPRLPSTVSASFSGVEGESLVHLLSGLGIYVSTGSACTTGSLEPSHVLRAMKVPEALIHGSIRFSFSRYATGEEIQRIGEALPAAVRKIRRLSPRSGDRSQGGDSSVRQEGSGWTS
ncbi:MAG: aminotransferase class V-fold PLP-dependent enzyme [Candidatus Sumerlaeota bacterium]|nr:aminotransferase class V-fold PLP-dependent enzyme [Candidatus Sumerlaeota bacterium]